MKGTIAVRVGLAIASVLLAGPAFAQGPGRWDGPGRWGMDDHRPPFERAFGGHGNRGTLVEQSAHCRNG